MDGKLAVGRNILESTAAQFSSLVKVDVGVGIAGVVHERSHQVNGNTIDSLCIIGVMHVDRIAVDLWMPSQEKKSMSANISSFMNYTTASDTNTPKLTHRAVHIDHLTNAQVIVGVDFAHILGLGELADAGGNVENRADISVIAAVSVEVIVQFDLVSRQLPHGSHNSLVQGSILKHGGEAAEQEDHQFHAMIKLRLEFLEDRTLVLVVAFPSFRLAFLYRRVRQVVSQSVV